MGAEGGVGGARRARDPGHVLVPLGRALSAAAAPGREAGPRGGDSAGGRAGAAGGGGAGPRRAAAAAGGGGAGARAGGGAAAAAGAPPAARPGTCGGAGRRAAGAPVAARFRLGGRCELGATSPSEREGRDGSGVAPPGAAFYTGTLPRWSAVNSSLSPRFLAV